MSRRGFLDMGSQRRPSWFDELLTPANPKPEAGYYTSCPASIAAEPCRHKKLTYHGCSPLTNLYIYYCEDCRETLRISPTELHARGPL